MVLDSAVNAGAVSRQNMAHLCVDSKVLEKNIAYPTDSQLLEKCRAKLVDFLSAHELYMRQSYSRQGPRAAQQAGRYAHARQFKRMRRQIKKLCTWVGRLSREIKRQMHLLPQHFGRAARHLIDQAEQLIYHRLASF